MSVHTIVKMNWKIPTAALCLFGFIKEMRPSEAFLTLYLTGPVKNLTIEEVDNEIYPWWTYSYLIWLVPVFLLTDYLRYKPVLILHGSAFLGTWALLLWAQGVPAMKCMQVLFGLVTASEVAYFSYLFVEVPKEHFKKVPSFTRAATLLGKFVAYVIAQIFYSFYVMDVYDLNVFSFVSVCIAFVITPFLPWPKHSEIFHRKYQSDESSANTIDIKNKLPSEVSDEKITSSTVVDTSKAPASTLDDKKDNNTFTSGLLFIWAETKSIYSSRIVILWSIWWALASCGNFQVLNYSQNLWTVISVQDSPGHNEDVYNGAVEAAATLISSIMVIIVGFLPIDWSKRAEFFMAIVCAGNAAVLIIMAHTSSIWVAYVMYVLFRISYSTVITIATAQIAEHLVKDRYGLVFGCNMFVALSIETILTVIVVDKAGLGVDVVVQYSVYGGYFGVLGLLFFLSALYRCAKPSHSVDLEMAAKVN